jgi:glycosyltransferase 2 family protein
MSRGVRIGVSVVISAVFLGFAVRGVDWWQAWAAMESANYLWILPMLPVTVWTLYIRAQRWRLFLHAVGVPHMRVLVAATNIGFMANMVLPLRIGEVIRPVLVSRRESLPLSGVLASVLLERIFDMFTILFLFGVAASLVQVSDQVRQWGIMLMTLALSVAAVIAFIRWQEELALGIARRVCDLLPGSGGEAVYGFISGFVQALSMLDSPAAFLRAFAWSLYLWLAIASMYIFAFIAFHLQVPTFVGALVMTAIVAIAVSVPSAPGYIGAYQLGCVLGLAIFGIAESDAIAFSLIAHLTQFVSVIGAGLYSLWTENISIKEVESAERSNGAVA